MSLEIIEKIFYDLVEDAKIGFSLNVYGDDFSFVRFNYIEDNNLNGISINELYGNDNAFDMEYEAEYSNGTIDYLPTLIVNNKEEFFLELYTLIKKYYEFYQMERAVNYFGEDSIIKNIILTILSNARYVDYENPIDYFKRYINYFDNVLDVSGESDEISILDSSIISYQNSKEEYGYETPYCFKMWITDGINRYNLPVINYGISNNVCYIYSIQNKMKNEDSVYNKRIKRLLNKVNANVSVDSDYEKNDTIMGVTPSFVLTMALFINLLKSNGIDDIRVITFLPDRYFEKKATEEYDADIIQRNLSEKLVWLFYRVKYHINDIDISYPLYDGVGEKDNGEDLFIKIGDSVDCNNNELLCDVLKKSSKKV